MNKIRKYTLLIFTLISIYAGAQLNLNINITYPAPGYLSDWVFGKSGMATLILNQENQLLKIKFQTQLQTLDGNIIATSNKAAAATYSIRTGANIFTLDKLLQLENLQFTDGNVIRSIQTSGKLPAGNYLLRIITEKGIVTQKISKQ